MGVHWQPSDLLTGIVVAIITFAVIAFVSKSSKPSMLDNIPTVDSSTWLGPWWARVMYLTNALDVIQEGYKKHKSAPFKIADLSRWYVVISHRKHVEELSRAPDDTVSLTEAMDEQLCFKYTIGPQDAVHVLPVIRSKLTRNIGALYPAIRDEINTAFDDILDLRGTEWKCVTVLGVVQEIVCRTSNRVFVGLPLCRDPDWIDLNINYTFDIAKGGFIIGLFPDLLKPIAARCLTNVNRCNQLGRKLLRPVIEERQKDINEHGKGYDEKPNDFLSWLMEEAESSTLTVKTLTTHVLAGNVAAIHSTSHTFTHVLLYLAANLQYIQPLREEVEAIIENEGWSKEAVDKMRKVDSFLKECSRLESVANATLARKALKDFTFSDGTFIPKGTMMFTAVGYLHRDETLYENAHAFEPFRFMTLGEEMDEHSQNQFVTTSIEYLTFGHNRHACPGRFFVVNEMKTMLAHVVTTYDIKLAGNTTRPPSLHFGTANLADPSAKIMFRRRVAND